MPNIEQLDFNPEDYEWEEELAWEGQILLKPKNEFDYDIWYFNDFYNFGNNRVRSEKGIIDLYNKEHLGHFGEFIFNTDIASLGTIKYFFIPNNFFALMKT